ncbi:hypothetical protein FACS189472_11740 [Alphaproteobacteria bacterium]|nr:hypothetical protein FACS189472_11740 [Alphaproteobacteria bacterium]
MMTKISNKVFALVCSCIGVVSAEAMINQENVALSKVNNTQSRNLMVIRTKGQNVQLDLMGAFQLCLCAAAQGHKEAQDILENMYRLGRCVALYLGPSRKMYSLPPELGNPSAQYNPGIMLYVQYKAAGHIACGVDVNIRNNKLLAHLSTFGIDAAFQMFLETGGWQNEFDFRLQWGRDITHIDPKQMQEWFLNAAVEGLAKIRRERRIGINSECMELDSNESWKWYTLLAAELGDAKSQSNIGFMCKEGLYCLPKNSVITFEWILKAANQNNAEAQLALGNLYSCGTATVKKDSAKAIEWYAKAAEGLARAAAKGDAEALCYLGIMHDEGYGMPEDPKKAFELYVQAANKGNARAQRNLGYMYRFGNSAVEKDFNKAFEWRMKAADQGDAIAQRCLGCMYREGIAVGGVDLKKALELFKKAAEQYDDYAQCIIGRMYFLGNDGVGRNLKEAMNWFWKAAKQDNEEAQAFVGVLYDIWGSHKDLCKNNLNF